MPVVKYSPIYSDQDNLIGNLNSMQTFNNGITYIKRGMPPKFANANGNASFAIGRAIYTQTSGTIDKNSTLTSGYRHKALDVIAPSQYIQRKKNLEIGKGTMSNDITKLSFKSYDPQAATSALRRCRNSGYVPPKNAKKYNCGC
jgi:hypothetical protein